MHTLLALFLLGAGSIPDRPQTVGCLFEGGDRPWVVAHRGASSDAPENTLAAFARAIELQADVIELDVQLTDDGEVICLHDDTLSRTTDGSGLASRRTLAELRGLDAGSWFGPEHAGQRIPTLAEVLDLAREKILVNIEIKRSAVTKVAEGGIVDRVLALVRQREMIDQVLLSSFEPRALRHARQLDPDLRTLLITRRSPKQLAQYQKRIGQLGASGIVLRKDRVSRKLRQSCRRPDCFLAVYTVNGEEPLRRWVERDVGAIFTDHPLTLLSLVGK